MEGVSPPSEDEMSCSVFAADEDGDDEDGDAYERERQRNIAANQAKLLELGLLNSSHALFGQAAAGRRRQWANGGDGGRCSSIATGGSAARRRSSRLQGHEAKHYGDELPRHERSSPSHASRRSSAGNSTRRSIETAGYRQEVYDEKHLLLLGTCETHYPRLFERKIYDQVHGTTCHQCRQKTIDKKTVCSKCRAIPGQFCGTCLQVRYGENVQEVWTNPDWVCPVCRDICNCSFCRTSKGWAPTGVLAHKARKAGFPSVAHYLITTYQREQQVPTEDQPVPDAVGEGREGEEEEEEDEEKEQASEIKKTRHDDGEGARGTQGTAGQVAATATKKNEGSETRKRKGEEVAVLNASVAGRQRRRHDQTTTATSRSTQTKRRKLAEAGGTKGPLLSYLSVRVPSPSEEQEQQVNEAGPYVDLGELKKGAVVACWADPSSGDSYWLARVLRGWSDQKKGKPHKTLRIRWFEELERKKRHFREGQEDDLVVDTIFHILTDENFVKVGRDRWRLEEDLSVYDL